MTDIPVSMNRVYGKLRSLYPAINPDNAWKIASPYRLDHVFPISLVHPRQNDSGSMAYFKWADTKSEYVCRPSWFGGEPPFRLTLVNAPAGMTIGGGTEQTFTRTLSAHAGIYTHSLPNDYATIRWSPTVGQHGNTYTVTLLVEDQTGGTLLITWTVTVDDTKFKYFDSVSGNNANAGTFAAPYQTFGYGYASVASAQNYIYKYKAGTYTIHSGVVENDASFDSTHCKSHIGITAGVIFDCTYGEFSGGLSDICLMNLKLTGGQPARSNVRQVNLTNRSDRAYINRVEFDTTEGGTQSPFADNPCGIMFSNIDPNWHYNVSITDCNLSATSTTGMYILFAVRDSIVENTTASGINISTTNGDIIGHFKDGCYNVGLRFSDYSGDPAGGVFFVSNQTPSRALNSDINYCRFVTTGSTYGATIRWNAQVPALENMPAGQYIQRCSIDANTVKPIKMEDSGAGSKVNYSGILWDSTWSTIDGGSTGGQSVGQTSVKVADINSISSDDIGKRGWVIASTLVV